MTMIAAEDGFNPGQSILWHSALGSVAIVAIFFGLGGWAAMTNISGALIAAGSIVVESDVKEVQHPTGGVIAALNVKDGDFVHAGDVLVRLDDTQIKANLQIVENSLDQLTARAARLESERDGLDTLKMPDAFLDRRSAPYVRQVMDGEQRLLDMRRTARAGKKDQLQQQLDQLGEEIRGLQAQQVSKARELDVVNDELGDLQSLLGKHLIEQTQVNAFKRDAARLEGDRAQINASIASSHEKEAEIRQQIVQIDQDLASEVSSDLQNIGPQISQLQGQRVTALDQLNHIDIRAPQDGIVHQLAVHTIGGVIQAGDRIMQIVPTHDTLDVEVKVAPQDIDRLAAGKTASLRFTAFDARTTPEIAGSVSLISADTITDQRTGQSYYTARLSIPPSEAARLGNVKLVPGMVVEAFIKTGERTVLSFLTKPLTDQMMKAFREK